MDADEANAFVRALTDIDWTNNNALNKLSVDLEQLGVNIPNSEIESFISSLKETGTVVNKIPLEKFKDGVNTLVKAAYSLIGSKDRSIDKDTYDLIKDLIPEMADKFIQSQKTGEWVFMGKSFDEFSE